MHNLSAILVDGVYAITARHHGKAGMMVAIINKAATALVVLMVSLMNEANVIETALEQWVAIAVNAGQNGSIPSWG